MGKRILLVEGRDDHHVVMALLTAHDVPDAFEIRVSYGIDALLESIPVWLKSSDIERLAVLLDADEDFVARWSSLRDRIRMSVNQEIPKSPAKEGTLVALGDDVSFGAWLMPDNSSQGSLEDFLSFLVPSEDKVIPRVDEFLAGLPADARRFSEQHVPKARIHSWLAVQKEPGKPLGQAITARYLDADARVVKPFVDWIRRVLVE